MKEYKIIDAIYKEIANKELSFGCIWQMQDWRTFKYCAFDNWLWLKEKMLKVSFGEDRSVVELFSDVKFTIIWHPLMIWDVLDWIDEKFDNPFKFAEYSVKLIWIWKQTRLPVEEQSEELIDYLYKLLWNNQDIKHT
jgi:hypothetical protein